MGPTGAGKSSVRHAGLDPTMYLRPTQFISRVTGKVDGVGHQLTSCTSDIGIIRCTIGVSKIVLVDTPGFDDTNKPDLEILELISAWLDKT